MKMTTMGFPIVDRGKRSSPVAYYPEAYFRAHGMIIRSEPKAMFSITNPKNGMVALSDIGADRYRCDEILKELGVTVLGEFDYRRKHF